MSIYRKALILVDIQNDFCPGGALAVPNGDQVVAVANSIRGKFDLIIATQDWHPADHGSFAANHPGKNVFEMTDLDGIQQVLWPSHCVQDTDGAKFRPELNMEGVIIVQKGTDPKIDSYSGFFDNARKKKTELHKILDDHDINMVFVMGLATDYCVKATAIDAADLGYDTYVIIDGCRGVALKPGDIERAYFEMGGAGIQGAFHSSDLDKYLRDCPET